jgi:F0F1-type ATP synthase assembly protein I
MGKKDSKSPKVLSSYAQAGQYIALGMQFAASILVFMLGGWWLDGKLDTLPLFLLLGTFLGAGAGFYRMYRTLVEAQKKEKRT